jgi:rhodanese-related sulfurtransferase
MKRVLLCCALLGALVLAAVACKSIASGATSSTAAKGEQAKPSPTDTDTTPPEPIKGSYETIPQDRAKSEMDALSAEGKPFVLLDVRRLDEYNESHIPGALLLPNELIGTARPQELPNLDVPIYVYCRSGRRSLEAAKKLAAMGYTVYDFGGIIDWQYGTVS